MLIKILSDKEIIERVVGIVRSCLPDSRIILFGSRAKNANNARSDFDIGVLWKDKIPLKVLSTISEGIETLSTLKTIDLVDIRRVDKGMKDIILNDRIVLYDGRSEISEE